MEIPIIFLGTSSGIPTATRNHTAILLSYKDEKILIDCGEGTQRQFRKAKINPCKITKLLITHLHGDHVFGLPGLFQTLGLNDYNKTLEIYGPKGTKKLIQGIQETFKSTKAVQIKTEIKEVQGEFFKNNDFSLKAISLEHGTPTNGYIFQEKDKLRIHKDKLKKLKLKNHKDLKKLTQGKDIKINNKTIKSKNLTYGQKGKKISFIFDTKLCSNIKKLAKDSSLAIMESTFFSDKDMKKTKQYKHLTIKEATKIAKDSNVQKLALTHFSQRYEFKEKELLKEAKKIFKETIIAKDFLKVEV
ncbi:ribonuclease Z [archaeon]|jgi:ribonuclease Z|nr:ribonuclease Z [archaeon]